MRSQVRRRRLLRKHQGRIRIFRLPSFKILLSYLLLACQDPNHLRVLPGAVNGLRHSPETQTTTIPEDSTLLLKYLRPTQGNPPTQGASIEESRTSNFTHNTSRVNLTLGNGAKEISLDTSDEINSYLNNSYKTSDAFELKEILMTRRRFFNKSFLRIVEQNRTTGIIKFMSFDKDTLKNINNTSFVDEREEMIAPFAQNFDSLNTTIDDLLYGFSSNIFLSCHERCGEDTNFPCSCDAKCVVYKNCCEDFAETCPQILDFALTQFQHLWFAAVRCDTVLAVFLVDSCPSLNRDDMPDSDALSYNTPSMVVSKNNNSDDTPWRPSSITEALANAPVTDYTTGIVFANASIYECYQRLSQDNSTKNATGTWLTQMGTKDNTVPEAINNLQQQLDLGSCSYIPPKSQPESAGSMCYHNWTIFCISMMSNELNVQHVICNMSVRDYYENRLGYLTTFWTYELKVQYICALCTLNYQRSAEQGERSFIKGFKILASLSETPGKISYASVAQPQSRRLGFVSWQSLICTSEDSYFRESGNASCNARLCAVGYVLTPDNLCRRKAQADISIQTEVLFQGGKCTIDAEKLFEAAKCFFETFFNLKVLNTPFQKRYMYDKQRHNNFTSIRMSMYFEVEDIEGEYFKLLDMYVPINTAMKVFTSHYCYLKQESENGKESDTQNIPASETVLDEKVRSGVSTVPLSKMLLNHVLFNYCVHIFFGDKLTYDNPDCVITSANPPHTQYDTKMSNFVSEVKRLKCLRGGSVDLAAKEFKARVSIKLIYFEIAVVVLNYFMQVL